MSKKGHYNGGGTMVHGGSELVSHSKPETFDVTETADVIEARENRRDAVVREIEEKNAEKEKMENLRMQGLMDRFS